MSIKQKQNESRTGVLSQHDAAALLLSEAITMRDEMDLPIQLHNLPGRGFFILVEGWYYDGRKLVREVVANSSGKVVANGSGKPEVAE